LDTNEIVYLYTIEEMSLRAIAAKFKTDHHGIKRKLVSAGVEIREKQKRVFSEEHRKNISKACRGRASWSTGKKMDRQALIKNMISHLEYDVSYEWADSFQDIEKLKFLNRSISRSRDRGGFTTETYIKFIEKFYYDENFNRLYELWIKTGNKWIKPSLDHIVPKSNNGELGIQNLTFLSWFENRAKADISLEEWNDIKNNMEYYLS
jgi:5-methylcytosine-specific restriction endonuclease McrA